MQDVMKGPSRRGALGVGAMVGGAGLVGTQPAFGMDNGAKGEFGFLAGDWRVHHRKLNHRLAGDTTWREFEGTTRGWTAMDGEGSFDDNVLDDPAGAYRAVTFRRRDPVTRHWAIWWFDGRVSGTNIDPPVVGSFMEGVGTFLASDTFEGKPILTRFIWSAITANSARWEQAFSPDRGETWETNWTMAFERVA